jgi:hypothetical protein
MATVRDPKSGMKKLTIPNKVAINISETYDVKWTRTDRGNLAFDMLEGITIKVGIITEYELCINKDDLIVMD